MTDQRHDYRLISINLSRKYPNRHENHEIDSPTSTFYVNVEQILV